MKWLVVLVMPLGVVGCRKHSRYENLDHEAARGVFEEIPVDAPPGLSGLALDDRDIIWALPERDRQLVAITLDAAGPAPNASVTRGGEHTATTKLYPLEGAPDDSDTEGLAYLGGNRFAIGIEGQDRPTAGVLFAELRGDRVVVTKSRALTDAELGVTLTINHGVEGACGRGDDVILGIESVGKLPDGARWAPIARLRGANLTVTKLRLTSDVGKISSLDCTIAADGTASVWAIERHYGVSRILRFTLPVGAAEVTPKIAFDLGPILRDSLNVEGIIQLRDGRLVAVVDNQGATVEGPNELLVFAPGVGVN